MLQRTAESLDEALLARLLEELGAAARAWRFEIAPNPCVGAAVLAAGRVVARGYHEHWGGPHAEIEVLRRARESDVPPSAWDLLAVTLEPCCSQGKTGPCVEAILASGIQRVVVGSLDPDARHRGAGLQKLREAGVEVYLMEGHAPLEQVAPHFLRWNLPERLRRPRPWTISKWAQTLSGQLQPPEEVGEGRWISCPESRAEVHALRAHVDAIVTGVDTVLADDPRLSVRLPASTERPPLRVVLDSFLRLPCEARLLEACAEGESAGALLVLTLAGADATRWRALEAAGAEVVGLRAGDTGSVSLRAVQTHLWERGVSRMLLESGPTLIERFIHRQFIDQLRVYTGDVKGGRGATLGKWLAEAKLEGRLDREVGTDAVLEAFLLYAKS
jgi:diaminohydroxyphosphoribosylaminopyrimidine deaminase/5-amino-6-(5-phosphoribosylamino)uracil reductase